MTKKTIKKTLLVAVLFGGLIVGYVWLNPATELSPDDSIAAESVKIPAPKQGEKKVVLEKLGMT